MTDFFKGKKTYIVAVLMVLLGFLTGDAKMLMDGMAFITLRAGISKM